MIVLANDSIDCGAITGPLQDRFVVVPYGCPLRKGEKCEKYEKKVYLVGGTFYRNHHGCSVLIKTEEQTLITPPLASSASTGTSVKLEGEAP